MCLIHQQASFDRCTLSVVVMQSGEAAQILVSSSFCLPLFIIIIVIIIRCHGSSDTSVPPLQPHINTAGQSINRANGLPPSDTTSAFSRSVDPERKDKNFTAAQHFAAPTLDLLGVSWYVFARKRDPEGV